MNKLLSITLAFAAGMLMGGIFFGGLWWTVRKGISSAQPALWFLGSLVLRTGIVLAGFYIVGRGNWKRMVSCLIGFILARLVVVYLTRTTAERPGAVAKEVGHAP